MGLDMILKVRDKLWAQQSIIYVSGRLVASNSDSAYYEGKEDFRFSNH